VVFHQLGKDTLVGIAEIMLASLVSRLNDRGIGIEFTDAAREQLIAEGYDPAFGARPLARTIQKRIENPLAGRILSGEFESGDVIIVDASGTSFTFTKGEAEHAAS
jgi:ATP-dependent Clp protease ATP-binding subunit ClpB